MNVFPPHHIDIIAIVISVALFILYNMFVWHKLRANPLYTVQGVSEEARERWVVSVLEEKNGILAVQTLRNSTMVATFMASTSVLLAMGVLSLTGQAENIGHAWHALNIFGSTAQAILDLKVLIMLLDLFIAFFCFSSSIRLYNHVGFMIGTYAAGENRSTQRWLITMYINRAAHHFYTGMRAFYFIVPLVFWIFGAQFLLAGTLLMIGIVHALDRTPRRRTR